MIELKTALKEEWEKFDVSVLHEVIGSMPRRIDAEDRADGVDGGGDDRGRGALPGGAGRAVRLGGFCEGAGGQSA